jgi:hypothetical protein
MRYGVDSHQGADVVHLLGDRRQGLPAGARQREPRDFDELVRWFAERNGAASLG